MAATRVPNFKKTGMIRHRESEGGGGGEVKGVKEREEGGGRSSDLCTSSQGITVQVNRALNCPVNQVSSFSRPQFKLSMSCTTQHHTTPHKL